MGLQNIQTLFREGKYEETIQAVDDSRFGEEKDEYIASCYKTLIFYLRGEINGATPLIEKLEDSLHT